MLQLVGNVFSPSSHCRALKAHLAAGWGCLPVCTRWILSSAPASRKVEKALDCLRYLPASGSG
jgi:hypothetical protein